MTEAAANASGGLGQVVMWMPWKRNQQEETRPLLDNGYLERLEMRLGTPMLAELLADGMIELSDRMARLDSLARADDRDGVASLAHDLVSVAGHMGLSALSGAAVELCRALRGEAESGTHMAAMLANEPSLRELARPTMALIQPSLRALGERTSGGSTSFGATSPEAAISSDGEKRPIK